MVSRDQERVELDQPPSFDFSEKVRACRAVRNDGTYPGREIGEILVQKGDVGYVVSIGTFLQQFYIYGVDFVARGCLVGMDRLPAKVIPGIRAIPFLPGHKSIAPVSPPI